MQEEKFLNVLKSRMVDGIIYVSSDYATSNKLLADLSIPVVFIDRKIEKSGNMGSVQIDNYQAMKEVAEYISKKGCKKIAYITADISVSPSRERYEGLMDGLKEAGIAFDKRLHYPGTFSVETGQIGAMTLLQRNLAILSLAWILQHPEISCVIAGASKPSQLENNLKASDLVIPQDAMDRIENILGFKRFERHVG